MAERHAMERTISEAPEEVRELPNGRVRRLVLEPRRRWSSDAKPLANKETCQAPHLGNHPSGRHAIGMDDGTQLMADPGDVTSLPGGHDARVVGGEPAIVADGFGASTHAMGG
jgi:hypothetical protein